MMLPDIEGERRAEFDAEGLHGGSRYLVRRGIITSGTGIITGGTEDRSTVMETIVLESPREVACRFILDESVYRGQSDLFKPIRLRSRIGLEIGPPFWRSDEPERLAALKQNATFRDITTRLYESAGFGALTVCSAGDRRLPWGSPAKELDREKDVIMLQRTGDDVALRSDAAIHRDLDQLAALRDLLTGNFIGADLPRAVPGRALGTAAARAGRIVILFFLAVAIIISTIYLLWHL